MRLEEIELATTELNKNYDNVFSHIADQCEKKVVINDPIDKCRFCDKSKPEVSFRKIAHAIPELIGNKKVFTNNECDSCNEKFSFYLEDSLGKYLGLWRTMMQIRGKAGIVSYKAPDGISRIDYEDNGLIVRSYENDSITEMKENENTITINGFRQPYVPIAVFKSFVKIALSIMPYNLLYYFNDTKKWLLEDLHTKTMYDIQPIFTLISTVPGVNPFGSLSVTIARRKTDLLKVPFMQMAIYFGNLGFQIIVPCRTKDYILNGQSLNIFPIPHPAWITSKYINDIAIDRIDLSGTETIKNGTISVTMGYHSFVRMTEK